MAHRAANSGTAFAAFVRTGRLLRRLSYRFLSVSNSVLASLVFLAVVLGDQRMPLLLPYYA